ncbi:DUF397 domain-containing protein [Streptomyces sp. NPDC005271]
MARGRAGSCIPQYPVLIRDSKARSGPVLTVTPEAWAGLVRLAADQTI